MDDYCTYYLCAYFVYKISICLFPKINPEKFSSLMHERIKSIGRQKNTWSGQNYVWPCYEGTCKLTLLEHSVHIFVYMIFSSFNFGSLLLFLLWERFVQINYKSWLKLLYIHTAPHTLTSRHIQAIKMDQKSFCNTYINIYS